MIAIATRFPLWLLTIYPTCKDVSSSAFAINFSAYNRLPKRANIKLFLTHSFRQKSSLRQHKTRYKSSKGSISQYSKFTRMSFTHIFHLIYVSSWVILNAEKQKFTGVMWSRKMFQKNPTAITYRFLFRFQSCSSSCLIPKWSPLLRLTDQLPTSSSLLLTFADLDLELSKFKASAAKAKTTTNSITSGTKICPSCGLLGRF